MVSVSGHGELIFSMGILFPRNYETTFALINIEVVQQVVEILPMYDKNPLVPHNQYHGWW